MESGNPTEPTVGGPAISGNPPATGTTGGPSDPGTPPSPPATTPAAGLSLEALQRQIEQQTQHITRLTDNYNGSRSEAQRLAQENRALQEQQAAFQQRLLSAVGGQPSQSQEPQYRSLEEAQDAWLNGRDQQALTRYMNNWGQNIAEQASRTTEERLAGITQPIQLANALATAYPEELSGPTAEGYSGVLGVYAQLEADPLTQALYPQDPKYTVSVPTGNSGERRNIDVRLMEKAVLRYRADHGESRGRQAESTRRQQPTVESGNSPGGAVSAPSEPNYWEAIGTDAQRSIENAIAHGVRLDGWPQVADPGHRRLAWAKHLYERRKARGEIS